MTRYRLSTVIIVIFLLFFTVSSTSLGAPPDNSSLANQQPASRPLTEAGPWLLYKAAMENGTLPLLWAINADGTGFSQIGYQPVLHFAVNPQPHSDGGRLVAYVGTAGDDPRQNLILYMVQLPHGAITQITPLTSADTSVLVDKNGELVGDRENLVLDIAAGLAFDGGLAWSPDGKWLAFTGGMDGDSLDLYSYEVATGMIRRLTDGPDLAYQLLWTEGSDQIIHSSNFCFLCMGGPYEGGQGIWGAAPDGSFVNQIEDDAPARFIGWQDPTHLLIDSGPRNGCWSDVRILDITDSSIEPLDFGCYGPVVYDDTGDHALLYAMGDSALLQDGPGLYFVDINTREVTYYLDDYATLWWDSDEERFLGAGALGFFAVTPDGVFERDAFSTTEVPSPDGEYSAWFELAPREGWGGGLWLQTGDAEPEKLIDDGGYSLAWSPDGSSFFYDQGRFALYLVVTESVIVTDSIEVLTLYNWPNPQNEWPQISMDSDATWVTG